MDSSDTKKKSSKKDPKSSQKFGREYLLRGVLFFLLFFIFLRKIILVNKNTYKLDKNFGTHYGIPSINMIKSKPFNPNLYSLRFDFASEESGTKIIAYSNSLTNLWNILNRDSGTYMLAPCQTTDWFVLSFPESILVQEISFLSYEFYASSYKNIRISVSNVYPSSKWLTIGEIETAPSTYEIFDLSVVCNTDQNDCWGKYLKVELLDYHKLEDNYYCSISKMVIYGITAVEYLESEIVEDKSLYETLKSTTGTKFEGSKKDKINTFTEISKIVPETPKLSSEYLSILSLDDSCSKSEKYHLDSLSNIKSLSKTSPDLSPTFLYDIKRTIVNLFYKFLMSLALRVDSDLHNKKLIYRILKIGKFKKYCGTNLLFQFNCNRFITYLLLEKYSHYYSNILDFVRLPSKHTWFEGVLFDFVKTKKYLVEKIINDVGIKEVPILVCLESFGVIPKYKCYFYFNLKSFSTLLFTQFSQGFKFSKLLSKQHQTKESNKYDDCFLNLLDKFYFYYTDGRVVVKKTSGKIKRFLRSDKGLVNRYNYKVIDHYISNLTFVGKLLYVNMSNDTPFYGTFDSDFNSPNLKKDLVEVDNNLYRAYLFKNITKYLEGRRNYYNINENFVKHDFNLDDKQQKTHDNLEQEEFIKKDSKTHKHVLLKLSERIKSLEYLTNKLSSKINNIEKLMSITLQQIYKVDEVKVKNDSDHKLNNLLNVMSINKFKILSKDGLNSKAKLKYKSSNYIEYYYYKKLKKYRNYEVGYLYIRSEDSKYFDKILCKLSNCVPYSNKCRRLFYQYHISKSRKLFVKQKLLNCMLSYGCKCLNIPNFARHVNPEHSWLYMFDFKKQNRYILLLNDLLFIFKVNLFACFNIYIFFVLFLFTQIFWICLYNSHTKKIKKLIYLQKA